MANISDTELQTIYNTLSTLDGVISDVQPPGGTSNIKQMVKGALNIVASKIQQSQKDAAAANPVGASAYSVTEKTKALFSMFHLRPKYEPQPIGASAADRMVSDWKAKKTKQLFEMFHLA